LLAATVSMAHNFRNVGHEMGFFRTWAVRE
jgi:hypothetical protein